MRARALAALTLAALALSPAARADDTWTTPFPGVRRLRRVGGNQHINALVINLCTPGVSARVTARSERARTVPSFGALVGAQVAVNGGFYNTSDLSMTDGFVLHDGVSWGGTDHGYVAPAAFGANRVELIAHEVVAGPAAWMREAVSGHPTLIHDGAVRNNSGDTSLCPRNPRTALGLSADRRTLILAVVDGRASTRVGMTCNELASLMRELGSHWAVNLDGGGSSTMWLSGVGVVNNPSAGSLRTVSNHLAIYARGSGAAAHCPLPAYAAQYVFQSFPLARTTLDLPPGGTFTGYLEMRNVGTATWTPARTRLGTTEPRDRSSPVRGPDWLAPNRAAAIDRRVAPGETGRFNFTLRAPTMPGEYSEYFNLVEEGVAWFGDPTQGGPRDNVIQVRVRTVPVADAGPPVTDAAPPEDVTATEDATVTEDAAVTEDATVTEDVAAVEDVSAVEDVTADVTARDAGSDVATRDAGEGDVTTSDAGPSGELGEEGPLEGGCACRASNPLRPSRPWPLAALALGLVITRRRRRV